MGEVELASAPGGGAIFRGAARGALRRKGRPSGLPDTVLVLRNASATPDRVAEYARVCGFRLENALPPTYPHVMAFPLAMRLMSGAQFPFPVVGLVHVANRIEVLRPIGAGERLDLRVEARHLREHDRGRQFDLHASARVGDTVVWRGVSTYLRKDAAATGGEVTRGPRPADLPEEPTATWRVGREVGVRYARVSGDRNPIHTSRLGARLFGFARPIAHGMWTKARCLAALEGRLPDGYVVEVAFKAPILLPSTVGFRADRTAPNGWTVVLRDAKTGRPHLSGAVTAPST
jgi:acyl dehydratase